MTSPQFIRTTDQRAADGRHRLSEYQCPLCGTLFLCRPYYVQHGDTKSCGCLQRLVSHNRKHYRDLAGKTIGNLHIEVEVGVSPAGRVLWRCTCTCGNEAILNSRTVQKGSCGCQGQKKRERSYLRKFKEKLK